MKKILLIGKFNSIFEGLNNYLAQDYNIQVCVDELELVQGILKMNQPDLIVYSMVGVEVVKLNIFFELKLNYAHIPVICYGSDTEQRCVGEILKMEPFHILERPAEGNIFKEMINSLLPGENSVENVSVAEEPTEKRKCVMSGQTASFPPDSPLPK